MILVAGSTGILGSEIVRQLREKDKPVRALVRKTSDPKKAALLKKQGVEIAQGDLIDKVSLVSACRGVDTVITTVTTTASQTPGDSIPKIDQLGQLQLVEAAAEAGVSHFIYMSYSRNISTNSPLTNAKRTVEQSVMASGMAYTILRPSYFMEVWLSPFIGFDYPNNQARIYGTGTNQISWISFVDVARMTVMAVETDAAHNRIFELGGPEPLSPNEVIKIFEKITSKPFQVEYVPVEVLQGQKAAAEDPLQQSFAALMLDYAKGDPTDPADTLKIFPISLTSVQDYARQVATEPIITAG